MAGTLVSYLPFTRSVTEDLSGKEWTVTGNPQIINRDDFSVPVAKFGSNDYLELNNLTVGGNNHWIMDFWIYIPQTSSTHHMIRIGGDDWFFALVHVLYSGELRIWQCTRDNLDVDYGHDNETSNTYFNKWINIKFAYTLYSDESTSTSSIHMYISDGTKWLESFNINNKRSYITKTAKLKIGPNILLSQFRFYTKTDTFYIRDFIPNPPTDSGNSNIYLPTRQSFAWNEFQVHDTINFDYMDNINYTTYSKSIQWYYKNIGTADGLLVSGTSLTNVDPSKSVTSKAFYQTNRKKCFDTQASKEIYMLFDVYFDGTNRWRAYEESSTNGVTGITAQTSGVLDIFSNGTSVGPSIPLTINKLETYFLYMRSDATNGYIEVWKDREWKYTYIGNVNNGDDFSNLELQSDGSGTVFSNIVISNQSINDTDRLMIGNYNNIQYTLTNETWVKEKCFKVGWPLNNILPINISWTATGNVSTSSDIKKEGISSIHLPNGAYLVSNDIINLNTDKWTFDCWAYLVSSSADNGYFALSARTDDNRYGIIVSNDGIWVADVTHGWQAKNESITFPSVKNQWVHLAIVKNGQQVTFYQNGTSVWSFQTTALDNSGKFILGGNNYGYNTDIYFDQVRFVKYTALWTENFIPPTTEDYETYQNSFLSGTLDPTLNIWFPFDQIIPLSFTGQNDSYAKLPLSVLPGETTFTIEVKFSTTSTASYTNNYSWKTIIGCEIQNYWQDDFGLCVNNGKLCFWAEPKTGGSDSSNNTTSNAIVNDGIIHTAAVVSSNGAIDLYCDGQHVAHTDNVNAKITSTYQIGIASNINNSDSSLLMNFYEARLWNVARTQDQIFADIDGTETGLQGWYKPSQNSLLDYSGNNRHATIYNASYDLTNALKSKTLNSTSKDLVPWSSSGTSPFITTINEINGKATQFGQGYLYTDPPELKSNNFTIDFWEYIPSTINGLTAQMVVIDGTDGTGTQCLDIGYDNGATVPSFWLGKGASSGWKYSNKIIGTKIRGQWVHRAVVRYDDKIYAFENGQLYTSFDIEAGMYIDVTGSSLFIGGFKRASRLHPGMLSEVRVYVGTALWTENFTPPNQEDYFETYWYFNKPAPILNTNYDIQLTLTNETWVKEKCLKSYLTTINNSLYALCGNQWNIYKSPSVVKTNYLNGKAISFSDKAYLQYQNGITLGGRSFTISGWFNMASNTGTWSRVFQLFTATGSETNAIRIARNGNNQNIVFSFYNATLTGTTTYAISYNTWYHFAFVYDKINSKVYIYINGEQIVSGNQTIPETNFTLWLGRSNYSADGYFVGQISEFMIHNKIALYTENFTPPNQEDYFETYWYFNQQAPILNTNYNTLRCITNNSIIWKYINPGYNDISPFTYTNSSVTPVQPHNDYTDMQVSGDINLNSDIYQYLCIKFDIYLGNALDTIFSFPYGKGTISISISKPESSTTYLAKITHERNEENPIGTQLSPETSYSDYELGKIGEEISFIIYIKSDAYNKGEIIIDSSSWIDTDDNRRVVLFSTGGRFHLSNANINEGNSLSKPLNVKCIYNLIVSNQKLTFDDMVAHQINPAQRSITNNEEWRIARYCLKSWMMFDESPTKDSCGNTWTATGSPVIEDNALKLNGSSYLKMTEKFVFTGQPFTVSCKFSATVTPSAPTPMVQLYNGNSVRIQIAVIYGGSTIQLWKDSESTVSISANSVVTDGKIHHAEFSYDGNSIWYLFLDGKLVGTQTHTPAAKTYTVYIGNNAATSRRFTGSIDEVQIYDGMALHTEEFTPPVVHQITDDKLYYDKSAETMKFESFADVQKETWNIAETTSKKILVSYLPFDGDVKDLCDDKRAIYIDGSTPVFSSQDSTKNKSLSLSNYDGSSYASRSYYAFFNLLPYDKSWKFIAELDIIANLPGDSFTAQSNHINIFQILSDSTTIVNILYWDSENPLGLQGATSNVAKLFIGNERYFSNPPDTFIDDYTLTAQSKKSFHVTIIFDNDELNPSTIIFLKPLDGGNSYIYRLIGDNISRYNKDYVIYFGGTNNATNGLNINIDEFKFYLDYNDSTPDTIIDKNIEVRFNNGEESVYFEFYANITFVIKLSIIPDLSICSYATTDNKFINTTNFKWTFDQGLRMVQGSDPVNSSSSLFTSSSSPINYAIMSKSYNPTMIHYSDGFVLILWYIFENLSYFPFSVTFDGYDCSTAYDYTFWNENGNHTFFIDGNESKYVSAGYNWVYPTAFHIAFRYTVNDKTMRVYINNNLEISQILSGIIDSVNFGWYDYNPSRIHEGVHAAVFFKSDIYRNGPFDIKKIGDIPSYKLLLLPFKIANPNFAIYHNNQTYYNKLVLPTDPNASKIRVYHNNTVYALSK